MRPADPEIDDGAGIAAPPRLAEIGDDRRGLRSAFVGLDGQQVGIAGAEPDADRGGRARSHSLSLATALMAATAIALPPLRPATTM